jgi:hypothetical protein
VTAVMRRNISSPFSSRIGPHGARPDAAEPKPDHRQAGIDAKSFGSKSRIMFADLLAQMNAFADKDMRRLIRGHDVVLLPS